MGDDLDGARARVRSVTEFKSWLKRNSTLIYFLVAQLIAIGVTAASVLSYVVRLETRVSIMETRGAAYTAERLGKIDERLTVLGEQGKSNKDSIDRIVTVMTRDLGKNPTARQP